MLRRLDRPTSLKPSTSVQNLCDSSMSRTLMTRWLIPAGVRASAGVSGTIFVVPSAIVVLRARRWISSEKYMGPLGALPITRPLSAVEPAPGEAQQPLRHEDNHGDEDDADR